MKIREQVKIGDRVFYKDNGPWDTGTIIDINLSDFPFVVKWDKSDGPDEDIDGFQGSQLVPLPLDE